MLHFGVATMYVELLLYSIDDKVLEVEMMGTLYYKPKVVNIQFLWVMAELVGAIDKPFKLWDEHSKYIIRSKLECLNPMKPNVYAIPLFSSTPIACR